MAQRGPSTSRDADIQTYYIKDLKMDILPHRDTVVPIKGPVIHNTSKFMASHMKLNYVHVSHHLNYVTGALITGALQYSSVCIQERAHVTGAPVTYVSILYLSTHNMGTRNWYKAGIF